MLEFCFSSREKLQTDLWARVLFLFHASIIFHVFLSCVTDVSRGIEIRSFLSHIFPHYLVEFDACGRCPTGIWNLLGWLLWMGTDLDLGYCVELLIAHLSKFLGSLKQGWVNSSS